jgi:hypothetical protein
MSDADGLRVARVVSTFNRSRSARLALDQWVRTIKVASTLEIATLMVKVISSSSIAAPRIRLPRPGEYTFHRRLE